jgi:hypothetical protein
MSRFIDIAEVNQVTPEAGDTTKGWYVGKRTSKEYTYIVCPECGEGRWVATAFRWQRKSDICRKCWGYLSYKKNLKLGKDTVHRPSPNRAAKIAEDAQGLSAPSQLTQKALSKNKGTQAWHKRIATAWREADVMLPQLIMKCCQLALDGDMEAMREIFNRRFGKVPEHLDVDASGKVYMTAETMAQALARAQIEEANIKKLRGNGHEDDNKEILAIESK